MLRVPLDCHGALRLLTMTGQLAHLRHCERSVAIHVAQRRAVAKSVLGLRRLLLVMPYELVGMIGILQPVGRIL